MKTWKPFLEVLEGRMIPSTGFGWEGFRDAPLPENKFGPYILAADGAGNVDFKQDAFDAVGWSKDSEGNLHLTWGDQYFIYPLVEESPPADEHPEDPPEEIPVDPVLPESTTPPDDSGDGGSGGFFAWLWGLIP